MSEHKTYTENHRDFYLEIPDSANDMQRVTVQSPSHPAGDTGIRLLCSQFQTSWNLQIRGFYRNANYRKGKKWYYAMANLGVDELRALRDACDAALADVEKVA